MHAFLAGTTEPLERAYRLALLDLDGVVYRGKDPVEHAAESIRTAERAGLFVRYTTNNSSRFQRVVADQLRGFGLTVDPTQVITSAVVAARMVARHVEPGSRVLVLGAEHLRQEVQSQGLTVVDDAASDPQAVIQGWHPGLTWRELAEVSNAVEHGARYFVTNRDLTLPREWGMAPGCGAMIRAVIEATGVEPVASAGKPESAMYDEARVLAAEGEEPVPKERCLAIGDRLDTDIEAGNRGGYDSMAVLTGVTNPRELILAAPEYRPTYIVRDLRGLQDAQPTPHRVDDAMWGCREAWARLRDDAVEVSAEDDLDALRAACCLLWEHRDAGDAGGWSLPEFHGEAFAR